MHKVRVKGILSKDNGINIYRGCQHGCIYCDSRSKCYHMEHDFEDIEVKENALELLETALRSKRKKCMIGTGAMSDPYIPLEKEIGNTRKVLELILKYGFGITLITKSDLILRDLDLLKEINSRTKCMVQMTLTTYDETLCKKIEPDVCTSKRRAEVLNILRENGIPTVVWLTPILPFINDTEENLKGILDYSREAGVKGIICFGMGLTLREGNREYFYTKLDEIFPGLADEYISIYKDRYNVVSPRNKRLMKFFNEYTERYSIMNDNEKIFSYLREFEDKKEEKQLYLF